MPRVAIEGVSGKEQGVVDGPRNDGAGCLLAGQVLALNGSFGFSDFFFLLFF